LNVETGQGRKLVGAAALIILARADFQYLLLLDFSVPSSTYIACAPLLLVNRVTLNAEAINMNVHDWTSKRLLHAGL